MVQTVKKLPAKQETWVRSLGWEDPLEEGMATHSNILAWRIPWIENLEGYSPWGQKELDMTERLMRTCRHACTHTHTHGPCKLPDLEKLKKDFSCRQDFSYSLSCLSTALGITDRWPEIFNTKIIRKPNITKY